MFHTRNILFATTMLLVCVALCAAPGTLTKLQIPTREVSVRVGKGEDLSQALKDIRALIANNPNADKESMAEMYFVLAVAYKNLGNAAKSQEAFKLIEDKYSSTRSARDIREHNSFVASQNAMMHTCPANIRKSDTAASVAGETKKCMQSLYDVGKHRECETIFNSFIAKFGMVKESKPIVILMITCHRSSGKYSDGVKLSSQLFAIFPKEKEVPYNMVIRAEMLKQLNRFEEAEQLFASAKKKEPSYCRPGYDCTS